MVALCSSTNDISSLSTLHEARQCLVLVQGVTSVYLPSNVSAMRSLLASRVGVSKVKCESDFDSIHILLLETSQRDQTTAPSTTKIQTHVSIVLLMNEVVCAELLVIGNCRSIEHLNAARLIFLEPVNQFHHKIVELNAARKLIRGCMRLALQSQGEPRPRLVTDSPGAELHPRGWIVIKIIKIIA